MDPQLATESHRCDWALTSFPSTRSSNFSPHASYLTFEIQSLFIRPFLAVTVDSDIRKTCEETEKRIDGNRNESYSNGDSFSGGGTSSLFLQARGPRPLHFLNSIRC